MLNKWQIKRFDNQIFYQIQKPYTINGSQCYIIPQLWHNHLWSIGCQYQALVHHCVFSCKPTNPIKIEGEDSFYSFLFGYNLKKNKNKKLQKISNTIL